MHVLEAKSNSFKVWQLEVVLWFNDLGNGILTNILELYTFLS